MSPKQRLLCYGVGLILLALLTGIWTGLVITGKLPGPDAHQSLATHLEALLNGMMLILLAVALDSARLNDSRKNLVVWLLIYEGYMNWFATGISAFWHVNGLDLAPSLGWKNNTIAVALYSVVLTGIVGLSLLLWGLIQQGLAESKPTESIRKTVAK
ncbi:MAG TPA: hypothetical protein VFC63_17430 [Blastocatellia bacterium]|nr:hypothetical protein [Blastocatellia bacterium]